MSLQVKMESVDKLIPYARNARTHSDEQVALIAGSIREFGFNNPVLVDGAKGIIAGHGRVLAARKLGLKTVPTLELAHLSETQKRAYILADNKLAERAGWDLDALKLELADLGPGAFEMVGFTPEDLQRISGPGGGLTDPDDAPAAPSAPVSRSGDMWSLGNHRLLCGDSTIESEIVRLCGGEKVDCVFTSPPYGVGINYGSTYHDTLNNLRSMLPKLARAWLQIVTAGGFAVVNFGDIISAQVAVASDEPCEYPMSVEYWPVFRNEGWLLFTRRVWAKPHARVAAPWTASSCRSASDWEHLWVWKTPGKPIIGRGAHSALGVWDTSKGHGVDVGKEFHGAGMPVALVTMSLESHSRPGSMIHEPFSGTGTTIIGAESIGRRCVACDISPAYVDMTIARWQAFTGKVATLEGRSFDEVAKERRAN